MKRLIAVLTALCLLAAFAGCKAPEKPSLAAYLSGLGLETRSVAVRELTSEEAPPPSSGGETGALPPDDTVVRGRVDAIEGATVADRERTWYIAVVTISVGDILHGSVGGKTLRAVTAAATNEDVEWLSDPRAGGLALGQSAEFVLRGTDDMTWEIAGTSFPVSDLAEYSLIGLG